MRKSLLATLFLLTSLTSYADITNSTAAKGSVTIENFKVENENIINVAKLLAKLTNKSLVLNPSVRGKITIELRGKFSGEELWNIFSKAIAQLGYTIRYDNNKGVVYIEPTNVARRFTHTGLNYGGEYSLLIIKLKYLTPSVVYEYVRHFLSPYGKAISLNPFGILLVRDFSSNLEFIKDFLHRIDRKEYLQSFKVYKLQYITVSEFRKVINPLIEWYKSRKRSTVYITELPEKNLLIISAPQGLQERIENLKKLVDRPTSNKNENYGFYLLKLKYTSVDEIEKVVNNILGKIRREKRNYIFPSGLQISFDKTDNAILIFGSKEAYENFKKLVSLVDRKKKQVLITALIIEASTRSFLDKGIKWQILGKNGGVAFGATSQQGLYEALAQGNFAIGALSKTGVNVSAGGSTLFFPDLLFLYSMLEQGSGFNVISSPKILTLDNKKAAIKVGQDVPFPTGIKYDVNGNPIITYDYKYVGLDLDVVPRVTGKNIHLVLNLKVQEITGYLNNNVGGINYSVPITSTRELNSDVIVENGQTIIIGGLISKKSLLSSSKVPGLGDIPLFGNLFKSNHKENDKTNLFIFITPYIISSPEELEKIMKIHKELADKLVKLEEKEKQKEEKVETQEDNEVVLPYN